MCNGMTFVTVEQFMMYGRADIFGDIGTAASALSTTYSHPAEHRKMGRVVEGFADSVRDCDCMRVVVTGNFCKFT